MGMEQKQSLFSQGGKKQMNPPWIVYPALWCHSTQWKLKEPSKYLESFTKFISELSKEERVKYASNYPEPVTWRGFYQGVLPDKAVICWKEDMLPRYCLGEIKANALQGMHQNLCLFYGHYQKTPGVIDKSCFSQWYKMPFMVEDVTYCCMEQFMMASKAKLFGDSCMYHRIMQTSDPKTIKALGRKVSSFRQDIWDTAKYTIVLNGNWAKFSQNPQLAKFLLSTGDAILAEASPYDGIWGIKLSASDLNSYNPANWKGFNLLGLALMEVRDELRRVHGDSFSQSLERK